MFLPISFLAKLVTMVMGFPEEASTITASFIKSPYGVQQACHMARDEMFQIDTDIWDEEVWGAASTAKKSKHPHPRPILRFLFARQDHWVADNTRDQLIASRGRLVYDGVEEAEAVGDEYEGWKPAMEIADREGWAHGFCIKDGVPVAERVAGYVRGMVARDRMVK